MEQKDAYDNFIRLFDKDDAVRMQALLEKKSWLFNQFYVPFDCEFPSPYEAGGLECLFASSLQFHRLAHQKVESRETSQAVEKFNERFRFIHLYKSIPQKKNKTGCFALADFTDLNKDTYKKIVASFFPCLPKEMFSEKFPLNDLRALFEGPMIGETGQSVIIADRASLNDKSRIHIDCLKKVFLFSDMEEHQKELLEKALHRLSITTEVIHV